MKNEDTVNVPVEPTREMTLAGARCLPSVDSVLVLASARSANVYPALLEAAPKAGPDWNYEGAMADLQSAITVLIRRINGEADLASAAEWVRLNYPSRAPEILARPEAPKVEQEPVGWDHNYRQLEKGEIVLSSDEVQHDDGSWHQCACVGREAPDPSYTSHRVYRRLKCPAPASDELQVFVDFIADEIHNLGLSNSKLELVKAAFRSLIGRYNAKHKGPQS